MYIKIFYALAMLSLLQTSFRPNQHSSKGQTYLFTNTVFYEEAQNLEKNVMSRIVMFLENLLHYEKLGKFKFIQGTIQGLQPCKFALANLKRLGLVFQIVYCELQWET